MQQVALDVDRSEGWNLWTRFTMSKLAIAVAFAISAVSLWLAKIAANDDRHVLLLVLGAIALGAFAASALAWGTGNHDKP